MRDMSVPIPADADAETLEARYLALIAEGQKIASMRRLTEAHQREVDRAAFGTPPHGGPSRAGLVKKRDAAIASMLGADRPIYATPLENLRAAQAAAEELNGLGADELPYMTRRIQQLIDAAAERHEAGARAESPPPRREHAATSRSPTASGARERKDKEPAASHSRTRITIERDAEGRPRAVERQGNPPPPPPRGERYPTPPPVTHLTLGGRLGHREGVGENDARHRIDR